jgi:hypothetical protein
VHRCEGCELVEDRDVAAARVIANRAAHMLNGSDESRVEDAPEGAPMKPNPRRRLDRDARIVTGGWLLAGPQPSAASAAPSTDFKRRRRSARGSRRVPAAAPPSVRRE